MRRKIAGVIVGILLATTTAWDGTINFNFSQKLSGAYGSQLSYTSGGYSITANGFGQNTSNLGPSIILMNLYVTTSGGDESGLGLAATDDHEIGIQQFIQLDLRNLANIGILSGNLTIGSVQPGEGYRVCTASALGSLGACSNTSNLANTPLEVSWSANNPILGVTPHVPAGGNGDADVLLTALSAATPQTPTPEPESLALMGTGLIGVGLICRRYSRLSGSKHSSSTKAATPRAL